MKRQLATALFGAAVLLSLISPVAAQSTRAYSLKNGDTITLASPGYDASGAPAYIGGQVAGQSASSPISSGLHLGSFSPGQVMID